MSTRTILETAAGLLLDEADERHQQNTSYMSAEWFDDPTGVSAEAQYHALVRSAMDLLWLAHDLTL